MPFYDYVCQSCGNEMEVMHSVHAEGPSVCPKCGGPMKKTFAAPAVHYKGSGWARKERSSTGKSSRQERKESPAGPGDGSDSQNGPGGSPSGSEPVAKEAAGTPASAKDPD